MKHIKYLLYLFCMLALISCEEQSKQDKIIKQEFVIIGKIKNFKDGIIYLKYLGKTDSALIKNGEYKFSGKLPYPQFAYIKFDQNNTYDFFIENDTIKISTEYKKDSINGNESVSNTIIQGSKVQDEYISSSEKLFAGVDSLNSDDFLLKLYKYIRNHPRSVVSAYYLIDNYENIEKSDRLGIDSIELAYNSFSDTLKKNTHICKLLSKRISVSKKLTIGSQALDFSQKDLDGKEVKLSSFKDKYILIDFWASWCVPCVRVLPEIKKMHDKYKNLVIISVSLDSEKELWKNSIIDNKMDWINVSDLKGWGNEVAKIYAISEVPYIILIDKNGKIKAKNPNINTLWTILSEIYEK